MANLVESFCALGAIAVPKESGHMLVFQGISGDDRVEVELLPGAKRVRLHTFFDGVPTSIVQVFENGDTLTVTEGKKTVSCQQPGALQQIPDVADAFDLSAPAIALLRAAGGNADFRALFRFTRFTGMAA